MAFLNTGDGGENLARGAVPALKGIMVDEGLLHRMQTSPDCRKALDRGHVLPIGHDREGHAGQDPPAIQQNRASAALTVAATFLGPGQAHVIAYRGEQGSARVQPQCVELTIDRQCHFIVESVATRISRGLRGRGRRRRSWIHGTIPMWCCVVNAS